jgi:hypothetical protein
VQRYTTDASTEVRDFVVAPGWPTDEWFHLALDVVLSPNPSQTSIRLMLSGSTMPSVQATGDIPLTPNVSAARLILGLYIGGGQTGCVSRYDSVLLETTP